MSGNSVGRRERGKERRKRKEVDCYGRGGIILVIYSGGCCSMCVQDNV